MFNLKIIWVFSNKYSVVGFQSWLSICHFWCVPSFVLRISATSCHLLRFWPGSFGGESIRKALILIWYGLQHVGQGYCCIDWNRSNQLRSRAGRKWKFSFFFCFLRTWFVVRIKFACFKTQWFYNITRWHDRTNELIYFYWQDLILNNKHFILSKIKTRSIKYTCHIAINETRKKVKTNLNQTKYPQRELCDLSDKIMI